MSVIPGSRSALVISVLLCAATPAGAQRITFNPAVTFGAVHTDNVEYVDQTGASDDTATTADVTLPLTRNLEQGSLRLTLGARRIAYQDSSQFDNTEQRVRFDFNRKGARGSSWRVNTRYLRTDEQQTSPILPTEIVPEENEAPDDADLSLTDRTERETVEGRVDYARKMGRKWSLNAGVIAGETNLTGGQDVEGRSWYGPRIGVQSTISRKTSLGIAYGFRRTELDVGGGEDFQTLDASLDRDIGRKLQFGLRVGGVTRRPEDSESDTYAFGSATVRFNNGLVAGPVRFRFQAGAEPSGGGSSRGTALNSTGGISISGVRTYPLNWRAGVIFTHRSPFESGVPTTETLSVTAGVEPSISRLIAFRVGVSYSDQTSDDATREATVTRVAVNLVVYPLGDKRISGRR